MAEGGSIDLGIDGVIDAVEVGRGGFATVYRARQPMLDRVVAVKLIHGSVVDPLSGERFMREVRAAGRLSQHPHVAPVYDVGTTAGKQPYLIMPFYTNGSLQSRLANGRAMPESEVASLGRTLAATLAYVHDHGVLHRDVKPANVLMSDVDQPVLCDFGVARLMGGTMTMHTTGTSVVTWAYGPPEAFTGGEPTPAWDVYSLAATMYAMLTGAPPFVDGPDANVFMVLNRIGNVDAPDLRERGVSRPLAAAIRTAMSKSPDDRPQTAAEFAEMLDRRSSTGSVPATAAVAAVTAPERPPQPEPVPEAEPHPEPAQEPERQPEPLPERHPQPAPERPPQPEPAPQPGPEREPQPEAALPPVPDPGAQPGAVDDLVAPTEPAWEIAARLAVVLAVIGAVLDLLGSDKPIFKDSSSTGYLGSEWADVQLWLPPVVLLAAIVLIFAPRRAAGWVIGAGLAYLAMGYASLTSWIVNYPDSTPAVTSMGLRSAGAAVVLAAIVIAWRSGQSHPPPPMWHVVAAIVGGAVALYGTNVAVGSSSDWHGWPHPYLFVAVTAAALAGLVLCLLLRPAFAPSALAPAGVVGVVYSVAQAGLLNEEDIGSLGAAFTAAAGFAVVAAVGVVEWRRPRTG